MITDAQFADWIAARRNKRPVVLVDIEAKDSGQNSLTLHLSTGRYTTATYPYRARLRDFALDWEFDPLDPGFSQVRAGDLEVLNPIGDLDSWRDLRMYGLTARLGDRTWDLADFRTVLTGSVYAVETEDNLLRISLRDRQTDADQIVNDLNISNAKPGTMAKALLTTHGPYSTGDLDTPAWNQLDTDFPWTGSLDGDGRHNLLDLLDDCLRGLPIGYGADRQGKLTVYRLSSPTGSSAFRPIRPLEPIEIERIPPLGEVTIRHTGLNPLAGDSDYDTTVHRFITKVNHPVWRSDSFQVAAIGQSNGVALANARLNTFNRAYDRVTVKTDLAVYLLKPGDEVQIIYDGHGYETGRHGVVTAIRERLREPNELEVWV